MRDTGTDAAGLPVRDISSLGLEPSDVGEVVSFLIRRGWAVLAPDTAPPRLLLTNKAVRELSHLVAKDE